MKLKRLFSLILCMILLTGLLGTSAFADLLPAIDIPGLPELPGIPDIPGPSGEQETVTVQQGESLTLSIEEQEGATYQWASGPLMLALFDITNATQPTYSPDTSNGGTMYYKVSVKIAGTVVSSKVFEVIVESGTSATLTLDTSNISSPVEYGSEKVIKAIYTGDVAPLMFYSWTVDGQELGMPVPSGSTSSSILMLDTTHAGSHTISCTVTPLGATPITSEEFQYTVSAKLPLTENVLFDSASSSLYAQNATVRATKKGAKILRQSPVNGQSEWIDNYYILLDSDTDDNAVVNCILYGNGDCEKYKNGISFPFLCPGVPVSMLASYEDAVNSGDISNTASIQ